MFTFIFNYRNTICIRQVKGDSLADAVEKWTSLLENVQFGKGDDKIKLNLDVLRAELKESRLVGLRDLQNVWCTFLQFESNAILNVVLTQGISEDSYSLDAEQV